MKLIIAGSRQVDDPAVLYGALEKSGWIARITEVVSGTARGVDRLGEEWAERKNKPVERFPADWHTYGKKAGFLRNREMAEYADALLVIWDLKSRGTKNMINEMLKQGKPVLIYPVKH